MTRTSVVRLALGGGVLGVVGGLLAVIGGSPLGWVAVACGLGVVVLAAVAGRQGSGR